MPTEPDESEMLKRLRALEEENARLRRAAGNHNSNELVVREGEYNGYPTLTFEGPFRSFTLGLKKLSIIKKAWPEVELFLQKHAPKKSAPKDRIDDDLKI